MSTTKDSEDGGVEVKSLSSVEISTPSKKSYVSQLRIWSGTYSQANFLKIFFHPFPFLLSPIVSHMYLLKFSKNLSRIPLPIDLVCVLCICMADRVVL